jgi:hypothetical protein
MLTAHQWVTQSGCKILSSNESYLSWPLSEACSSIFERSRDDVSLSELLQGCTSPGHLSSSWLLRREESCKGSLPPSCYQTQHPECIHFNGRNYFLFIKKHSSRVTQRNLTKHWQQKTICDQQSSTSVHMYRVTRDTSITFLFISY